MAKGRTKHVVTYAAWLLLAAAFVFPFYWMLNLSLKGPDALGEYPPRLLPIRDETVVLPEREVSVVQITEAGKPRQALLLGTTADNKSVVVRMLKDGEATADHRAVPLGEVRELGETRHIGGQSVPVAVTEANVRLAVIGRRDTPGGQTVFWDDLGVRRPGCVGFSPAESLRPSRRLEPRWRNYVEAFTRLPFLTFFRNSLFICVMCTFGQLLSASMAAYAFARLQFRGRDFWFMVLLATMMIPAEVTLIPMFLGYKTIGWVDSFLPLIVPQFCAGAFNVFLLRQFFLTIPRELDEAAMIDGAGHFTIYWRIVLPLAKPALIVVGVFTFVWFWKDLMGPLIYLDSMDKRTVALGLEYFRNPHEPNSHLMMAAAAVAMLPVALLFFLCQKYILKGIALTGIKR